MAKAVLANPDDAQTKLTILYQNRHQSDILLRKELTALAEAVGDRCKLVFACSRAEADFSRSGVVQQVPASPFVATRVTVACGRL